MQRSRLTFSSKIEVRNSPIEGFGVFAKEFIGKGEILEESPFLILPSFILTAKGVFDSFKNQNLLHPREKYTANLIKNLGFKDTEEYYFKWMPKHQPEGEEIVYTVLPLGFGPIYNSSNSTNNAEWRIEDKIFVFTASRDIQVREEIFTFYGYFLDENGTKFECDDVFNIGLDYFNGDVGFKSVRFGNIKSYTASQNNPFFIQLSSLLKQTYHPIYIKNIIGLSALDQIMANVTIPRNVTLKDLFNKLKEAKYTTLPQIKFIFELMDKETNLIREVEVLWKR